MRLVDRPYLAPGTCAKCRSVHREKFVDLDVDFEFEGHLYICDRCVIEMANLICYVPTLKIPDGFPGLVKEASETLERHLGQLNDSLAPGLRNLSAIASAITNMAEQQAEHVKRQFTERTIEAEPTGKESSPGSEQVPSASASLKKLGAASKRSSTSGSDPIDF